MRPENLMVLNRNAVLSSIVVGRIVFQAGVPVCVPPRGHQEAMAMGAEFASGAKFEPKQTILPEEETDLTKRMQAISAILPAIVERNRKGDFTAAGIPNTTIFRDLIGFKPDAREVYACWRELQSKTAIDKQAVQIANRPAPKTRKKRAKKTETDE